MSRKPAPVVLSPTIELRPVRPRSPHSFATRNCVLCGGDLPDASEDCDCASCGKHSGVALCEHQHPRPAWRITRWHPNGKGGARRKEVVAVTVGDVTVFLGRFRDVVELRSEDGSRLPIRRAKAIEPGAEILERLTAIGTCYRCNMAFFLPDGEVSSTGAPRILRVPFERPTRQYMKPEPDPARISAVYLALGTAPARMLEDEL